MRTSQRRGAIWQRNEAAGRGEKKISLRLAKDEKSIYNAHPCRDAEMRRRRKSSLKTWQRTDKCGNRG